MTVATADRKPSRPAWMAVALAWLGTLAVMLMWLLGT
jgi:hypothetical protein